MLQPVYTLLCEKDLPMALITLPKILKFLKKDQQLFIVDDGSFSDSTVEILKALSDRVEVITRKQRESHVLDLLGNRPNCIAYREKYPFAFKLLDIPLLAREKITRYTYTDSDIIYIKNCEAYFNRSVNTYLMTDAIKLSFKLKHALLKYRWKVPFKFNAGYFSYDTTNYDLDFIEYYLGLPEVHNIPWVSEQACWALIFGKSGESYCPLENEFVCRENFLKPNSSTLAIHLIGNLKSKLKEWSQESEMSEDKVLSPSFVLSRSVTIMDWIKKTTDRFRKAL